ncbi:hypothetical protein [Mucilaginibacter glaciei]|uniref:Uncharacterized protein n=1 Tax=Mucilaginibacter glaciei TaxID=2772109 RepID=A0A926NUY0_9SPHI|nr:hypothetical protein [Mucilaginibacter glaciei]MBD1392233.1 hypothetical protein [Mucilaginibacter glaciei]
MNKNQICKVLGVFIFLNVVSCSKDNTVTPSSGNSTGGTSGGTTTPQFTGPNTGATNLTVRLIYLVPADRALNQQYTDAVTAGVTQLTAWYKSTLGTNKTFHLNTQIVETIKSTQNAAWFNASNSTSGTDAQYYFYNNARNDIKSLLGTGYDESKYVYLVYVDAQGATGAGALGFTAMPENDLKGLTNQMTEPVSRWVGGAGHELGHAFGLPHPDNQNPQALMWTGYTIFPNCIFQANDKTILNGSKFFY